MPPHIAPEVEVALINAASSITVEFLRNSRGALDQNQEKTDNYFDEYFVSYYFRNVLFALRHSYLDSLLNP
ncbi:hypothetical protein [Acetobacter senegalensis]